MHPPNDLFWNAQHFPSSLGGRTTPMSVIGAWINQLWFIPGDGIALKKIGINGWCPQRGWASHTLFRV